MAIKITFPVLESTKTAPSLYQWDYGQILEIESADLAPIVEVHFACSGMTEAIVRPCSVNNGIATVPIPDICLEHAGTIMAWVFEINGTEGMTRKTITIPVIGRVKPAPGGEIPAEFHDRYTELITEIGEAIGELTKGNVTVTQAKNANYATEAGHATTAGFADESRWSATTSVIVPSAEDTSSASSSKGIDKAGIYVVDIYSGSESRYYTAVIVIPSLARAAYSTIAKDILKNVSCQVVYNPQGTNEAGNRWGVLQIEHDSDYDYNYNFTKCVRIADFY